MHLDVVSREVLHALCQPFRILSVIPEGLQLQACLPLLAVKGQEHLLLEGTLLGVDGQRVVVPDTKLCTSCMLSSFPYVNRLSCPFYQVL